MNLYRSFFTVGSFTGLSRVLGFVRDILIAAVLGTGAVADAFFVAFRLPNLFRRLFAEGAFNSAFVPLFAKRMESEGEGEARAFAEEVLAMLLFALLLMTAVAMFIMPLLITIFAPGFAANEEKFDLTVLLTRITFPYLMCMSLVALLSGILNTLRRFSAAAFAPVILNLVLCAVMAAAAYLGLGNTPEAGIVLAWGVAFAGFLQLVFLALMSRRSGMDLGFRRPRLTPGVKRMVVLGIPGLIAGGVTQINITVGTIIASLQEGAVSFLYYADRIYQLPLGIVGVAIGVVLLPDISRRLGAGDIKAVHNSQNRSIEFALLLTLPAAVALAVIAEPIIRVLFERGAFSAEDTRATAAALAAYAWGLPAFVLIKVFSPGFFAREDTKTPMYYAAAGMVVNVAGSLALFFWLGHVGIAVATSIAGWVNALLLGVTLARRGHLVADAALLKRVPLLMASSAAMGALLYFASTGINGYFDPAGGLLRQVTALGALIAAGFIVYVLIANLSGAMTLSMFRRAMRRS